MLEQLVARLEGQGAGADPVGLRGDRFRDHEDAQGRRRRGASDPQSLLGTDAAMGHADWANRSSSCF